MASGAAVRASASSHLTAKTVTIANGASLSDACDLEGGTVVAIGLPTLTSATISFQTSMDGTTYQSAYDSGGTELALGSASTGAVNLAAPAGLVGTHIKVRSGSAGSAVNQGAARTITLLIRVT